MLGAWSGEGHIATKMGNHDRPRSHERRYGTHDKPCQRSKLALQYLLLSRGCDARYSQTRLSGSRGICRAFQEILLVVDCISVQYGAVTNVVPMMLFPGGCPSLPWLQNGTKC